MRRRPALLLALALAACSASSEPGGGNAPAAHPKLKRYAPALLPYRLSEATVVPRNIWYTDPTPPFRRLEVTTPLVAVAALPRKLGVVFPPEDRRGFDLAIGGIDAPWSRVPLIDTHFDEIGALDAIGGGDDGSFYVVFRERRGTGGITLVTVRPDGQVQREPVPRPGPAAYNNDDRCPDLALSLSPAGDLDLVYRHTNAAPPFGRQVLLARRPRGASTFTNHVIHDTGDGLMDPTKERQDFGCRSAISYDDTDEPFILALRRGLPPNPADPTSRGPANATQTFLRGADGKWRGLGVSLYRVPEGAPFYRGDVDLERHPRGIILAAAAYSVLDLWLPAFSLRQDVDGPLDKPVGPWHRQFAEEQLDHVANGGKIVVDPCGGASLWSYTNGLVAQLIQAPLGGHRCDLPSNAPVIRTAEQTIKGPVGHPTFTHGPRPYTAALCVGPQRELVVCAGQWDIGFTPTDPPTLPDDQITLTATSVTAPAPGSSTLEFIQTPSTLTGLEVVNVTENRGVEQQSYSVDPGSGRVTWTARTPFQAGFRYRVIFPPLISGKAVAYPWQYVDQPYPSFTFDVAGSLQVRPDPRTLPLHLRCLGEFARAADGVCESTTEIAPDRATNARIQVGFDRFLEEPFLYDYGVFNARGERSELAVIQILPRDPSFFVTFNAALEPGMTYSIRLPALVDVYGQTLDPADRVIRFRTTAGPVKLESTIPAEGATAVAVDAPLVVRFTAPVMPATLVDPGIVLADAQTHTPVALSLLQDSPTAFRLAHAPLGHDTAYELRLGPTIQGMVGGPLTGAPLTIHFRTAP